MELDTLREQVAELQAQQSQHVEVEEELRRSVEMFRGIMDHAADLFLVHNTVGKTFDVSQMACDALGFSREELMDLYCWEYVPSMPVGGPETWKQWSPDLNFTDESIFRRKDGTTFPVETRARTFELRGQQLFLILARDITERHQAEEAKRELAVLEERNRLARDLHDSVTQSLYSLTLFSETARNLANPGNLGRLSHYLTRIGETALQALKELRLLVHELRPLELETEGLKGALRQRLDAVERRAGVDAQLLFEGHIELPTHLEYELYRVAQEALNNSLKHAGATLLTVRVVADGQHIQLEIEDNGKGFDVEQASAKGGMGLANMRERVAALEGVLDILSTPAEEDTSGESETMGSRITVTVRAPGNL